MRTSRKPAQARWRTMGLVCTWAIVAGWAGGCNGPRLIRLIRARRLLSVALPVHHDASGFGVGNVRGVQGGGDSLALRPLA